MYKLVSNTNPDDSTELESSTFELALEEALYCLQWYIIDEGNHFVAVNDNDSKDTRDLSEQTYEDAQYEAIDTLGYHITEVRE
jgi:hypothetical protein